MAKGWDTLTREEQETVRADHETLINSGVRVSLSQVAAAAADVRNWRINKHTLGQLCTRQGWDRDTVHPEYRTSDSELMVYLPADQLHAARHDAKEMTGQVEHGMRLRSGKIRPMPTVDVHQRNNNPQRRILSGRAWASEEDGMAWAELLANPAPHPEGGYHCLLCGVGGADRLREDADDRSGLICGTCADQNDMSKAVFRPDE